MDEMGGMNPVFLMVDMFLRLYLIEMIRVLAWLPAILAAAWAHAKWSD